GHLVRQDVALVDPDLDADTTICGLSFTEAVINVCTQSVQRNTAFTIKLTTSHFRTAKTTSTLNTDAQSASLLHCLNSTLHGTTEAHTVCQLVSNALCNKSCIKL